MIALQAVKAVLKPPQAKPESKLGGMLQFPAEIACMAQPTVTHFDGRQAIASFGFVGPAICTPMRNTAMSPSYPCLAGECAFRLGYDECVTCEHLESHKATMILAGMERQPPGEGTLWKDRGRDRLVMLATAFAAGCALLAGTA